MKHSHIHLTFVGKTQLYGHSTLDREIVYLTQRFDKNYEATTSYTISRK